MLTCRCIVEVLIYDLIQDLRTRVNLESMDDNDTTGDCTYVMPEKVHKGGT